MTNILTRDAGAGLLAGRERPVRPGLVLAVVLIGQFMAVLDASIVNVAAPSIHASLDVRTSYDVIFKSIRDASLSANLRSTTRGFLDLTWSLSRDLEGRALQSQLGGQFVQIVDRDQIGLFGETNLLGRRILLGMQANYELGFLPVGEPRLRDQRYKFGYNTQCCGFQVEVLNRNFFGASQREFRFLINLKGVGNVRPEGVGRAAGFRNGGRRGLRAISIAIRANQGRALAGKPLCNRRTQPAAGSGEYSLWASRTASGYCRCGAPRGRGECPHRRRQGRILS